MSESTKKLEL